MSDGKWVVFVTNCCYFLLHACGGAIALMSGHALASSYAVSSTRGAAAASWYGGGRAAIVETTPPRRCPWRAVTCAANVHGSDASVAGRTECVVDFAAALAASALTIAFRATA